jgi:hypothetical protein
MADWFGVAAGTVTYGRLGVIYTGDRPAVEVLEILAPVRKSGSGSGSERYDQDNTPPGLFSQS